ncbi:hypothetical protein RND81_13G024900 [Saponaria officinalis]|uniref:AP2/ERF domain-containing protein n=1 Tax=Saponaria officinalis TaxID=3572 RepID=A0AAW1H3I6_SAPOF
MERVVESSRFRGVTRVRTGWVAKISAFGQIYRLGAYDTEVEAAIAFDRASFKIYRRRFLNFPSSVPSVSEREAMMANERYNAYVNEQMQILEDRQTASATESAKPVMLFGIQIG